MKIRHFAIGLAVVMSIGQWVSCDASEQILVSEPLSNFPAISYGGIGLSGFTFVKGGNGQDVPVDASGVTVEFGLVDEVDPFVAFRAQWSDTSNNGYGQGCAIEYDLNVINASSGVRLLGMQLMGDLGSSLLDRSSASVFADVYPDSNSSGIPIGRVEVVNGWWGHQTSAWLSLGGMEKVHIASEVHANNEGSIPEVTRFRERFALVPEPSSLALLGVAALGLLPFTRRHHH